MGIIRKARMGLAVGIAKRAQLDKREARRLNDEVFKPKLGQTRLHILKHTTQPIHPRMQPEHGLYTYTKQGKAVITRKGEKQLAEAAWLDNKANKMRKTARFVAGKRQPKK